MGAKLLVKGELTLCALYRCQQQKLHTYTAAVPFSQIVDSPAGGEEGDVAARVQLICGEARLLRTEESSGFSVSAELRLLLRITRKETVSCVTDLYSTHCGTKLETAERSLPLAPERPVRQEAVQHLDFGRQRPSCSLRIPPARPPPEKTVRPAPTCVCVCCIWTRRRPRPSPKKWRSCRWERERSVPCAAHRR